MGIFYEKDKGIFTLHTENSTYAFMVEPLGVVTHLYYGERIRSDGDLSYLSNFSSVGRPTLYPDLSFAEYEKGGEKYCPHARLQEYSGFGIGDGRSTCLQGRFADGSQTIDLRYHSHEILSGKPALPGMPAVYVNDNEQAQTLVLTLKDKAKELYVKLFYTVIDGHDQIMRSVRILNKTGEVFFVDCAFSGILDIPEKDFDVISFYGKPNNERFVDRSPIRHGKLSCESTLGLTNHFTNNSMILCAPAATEDSGDCYGMMLVYSGCFTVSAELDHAGRVRLGAGIHPAGFCWKLEDGEEFATPEVIFSYTNQGLGQLSRGFHDLLRYNVCRGKWKDARRPVLINSWEAAVFDFDEDKLVEIAKGAKEFGVEMLVMDDGWFGCRDWDDRSLGDWTEYAKKLPNGISGLCKRLREIGMDLGVWFEPETVSENSDLYRAHPDYAVQIPGRAPFRGRWELVLDMSREEVRENIYQQVAKILTESPVSYIKWDFNRYITDAYSLALDAHRQGEFFHRYVLGVYEFMEKIHQNFPHVLLENCCSGGGRFDAGMLYYSPQIWCSDNTCPAHRMQIQYGTSLLYPVSTMGSHIAYSPNVNTYHSASVLTRGVSAMAGTFGYELDPAHESEKSKQEMLVMTQLYKKHYFTINHGDYYRLLSPYEQSAPTTRISAWEFVSKDKANALFSMVQMDNVNDRADFRIKLKGLDESKKYRLHMYFDNRGGKETNFAPYLDEKDLGVFSGEILMKAGLHLTLLRGDNMSTLIELEAE